MNDCKKCHDLFVEALYEELNAEQKHFFTEHLQLCDKCKTEYTKMSASLKIMDKRVRPEPGQAFWNGYTNRLFQRMEDKKIFDEKSEPWWRTFGRTLSSTPRWAYQAIAALLLVAVGIFIGRMIFSPSITEIQSSQQITSIQTQQAHRADLAHRTQNYIERSKLILLALINFDPEIDDPYALNLPYQKQVSTELVQEASYLKGELGEYDQERMQSLVADLEMILLQIANLESEYDLRAIDLVKEGVERGGILLKINITDIRQSIKKEKRTMPLRKASDKILGI